MMYSFFRSCPFFNFPYGGIIMMILFVVLIAIVLFLILRSNDKTDSHSKVEKEEDPIEVLKLRYAKGLITKEEFLRMKEDLK
ncbi:MAG: SHOCT domain-containing protein [Pleomorphochaeta sp.]